MLNEKLNNLLDLIPRFEFQTPFYLVGGTALQYHINHRESFDIDLATTNSTLDRDEMNRLIAYLEDHSVTVTDALSEVAQLEWEDAGFDLRDYQQEFLLDGIKFQAFKFQGTPEERAILEQDESEPLNNIQIASPSAIFKMKSLLLLKRHKSRDNFDLYHLVNDHGFKTSDIIGTIRHYQPHNSLKKAVNNLTSANYPLADEPVSENVSVSLTQMRRFFQKELSEIRPRSTADNEFGI